MALTPSKMLALASIAPDFILPDTVSGRNVSLSEIKSETATVVMFICNHCPFVKHISVELGIVAQDYVEKGISFVAINSNDVVNYPEDAPDRMLNFALKNKFSFPYLYDESQEVARAYQAACTPDFFIFDKDLKLVYRGQFDDARPGNGVPVTGKDLSAALDDMLYGSNGIVNFEQKPSLGCNIKWRE